MPESSLTMILNESKKSKSPSRKRYKKSRKVVVTDDFNKEAICRTIYRLYEQKEHVTLSKLLVCLYNSTINMIFHLCM